MEPTNFNLNNNAIIIAPQKEEDLTSFLQKIPQHIIVEITRKLSYPEMLALATTCRLFTTMKVEFLKVSYYHQLQLKKKLLIEDFGKEIDVLLSKTPKRS